MSQTARRPAEATPTGRHQGTTIDQSLAPPECTRNGQEDGVTIRIVKQTAPPAFTTEATSLEVFGVPGNEWHALLRRLAVPYARVGSRKDGRHIAETTVVAEKLREAALRRPGPKPRAATPAGDVMSLLRRAGFRKATP
jgi:hypothetical protein